MRKKQSTVEAKKTKRRAHPRHFRNMKEITTRIDGRAPRQWSIDHRSTWSASMLYATKWLHLQENVWNWWTKGPLQQDGIKRNASTSDSSGIQATVSVGGLPPKGCTVRETIGNLREKPVTYLKNLLKLTLNLGHVLQLTATCWGQQT